MKNRIEVNGQTFSRTLFVLTLLIGTFCDMLNQTVMAVAQPKLMSTFSVSTATIQWLTTGFLLVMGIMVPITGWLTDRFNVKWLYIFSQLLFLTGTFLSFVAPSFGALLAGRLIQAAGSGIASPLTMTMLFAIFPPEKQGAAMGLMGIVFGLEPAIGPTFSGWMVDSFSWRYIFGLILPITMIVLVISLWTIKNVIPQRKTPLDILSVFESTVGFGSLLYGFSAAGNDGWLSGNVVIAILVGVAVIGFFGYRQLHITDPLLNLTPFKARNFTLGTLVGCGVMAAMIGFEIVLPMYLQIIRGLSAIDSGLSLLAGALVTALMSPIAGMAVDKYGAKRLLVIGMSILTIGTVPFAFVTTHTSIVAIIVLYAVRTFGISLSLMPASTLAFAAAPMNLMGHASANNNVARQIASAVATAVLVSVFANVTKANMPAKHLLNVDPLAYKHGAFDALLSGYHVAFWLTALMSLIGIGLALLAQERSATESVSDNTIATEQA